MLPVRNGEQANYPRPREQTDREKRNGLQAPDSSLSGAATTAIGHKRDTPVSLQVRAVVQLKAEASSRSRRIFWDHGKHYQPSADDHHRSGTEQSHGGGGV